MLGIEPQHQSEPELRRTTLARNEFQLVPDQRPIVDQLILVQLLSHGRKLHRHNRHTPKTGSPGMNVDRQGDRSWSRRTRHNGARKSGGTRAGT